MMKKVIAFPLILLTVLTILSFTFTNATGYSERLDVAAKYLVNCYNPSLHLVYEAPHAAPNTYWVVSDNLLVQYVLKNFNQTISNEIKGRLVEIADQYSLPQDKEGLPISYKHEALIGEQIPLPFVDINRYTLFTINDSQIKTEVYNRSAPFPDQDEYIDHLCYKALSYYYAGEKDNATRYFQIAKSMWDGKGLADKGFNASDPQYRLRKYETVKLAIFWYTSIVLGEKLDFDKELRAAIWRMQQPNGGIVTHYYPDGTPCGDTNSETTAISILAELTFLKVNDTSSSVGLYLEFAAIVLTVSSIVVVVAIYYYRLRK